MISLAWKRLRRRGSVARRAGRRGRGGNSQVLHCREQADLGRDRPLDLVVPEVPATPRVRSRAASGVGGAGVTHRDVSAVSRPISVGIGPVIWLEGPHLRRRRSVARRAGRRGRGGNSQGLRRMGVVGFTKDRDACGVTPRPSEIAAVRRAAGRDEVGVAGLGVARLDVAESERKCAGDLVVVEVPATPRNGRAARRASGTRRELAGTPAPGAGRSRSGSCRRSRFRRRPCGR